MAEAIGLGEALFFSFCFEVSGGNLSVSQVVGIEQPVLDQDGSPLQGNDPSGSAFGFTYVQGSLVQVIQALDGVIHPPESDGQPHPYNSVLATARIGQGTAPHLQQPAMFSSALSPRPSGNSRIFLRVFNDATLEGASYYGDSDLFTVSSYKNEPFSAVVPATDQELDSADDDGDGLSNSREKAIGSDGASDDTDGDGFSDYAEWLAFTDLLDSSDKLEVDCRLELEQGKLVLAWNTVPGAVYRVQAMRHINDGDASNTTLTSIEAQGARTEYPVETWGDTEAGFYRVTVQARTSR